MTRGKVWTVVAGYLLIAFAYALWDSGVAISNLSVRSIGEIVGGGVGLVLLSGLLPVLVWGLTGLRVEKAKTFLFIWLCLGVGLAAVSSYGNNITRQVRAASPPTMDRGQFIAAAKAACLRNQRENPETSRAGISDERIVAYCSCFADVASASITPEEMRYGEQNGVQAPSFAQKQGAIRALCMSRTTGM